GLTKTSWPGGSADFMKRALLFDDFENWRITNKDIASTEHFTFWVGVIAISFAFASPNLPCLLGNTPNTTSQHRSLAPKSSDQQIRDASTGTPSLKVVPTRA